MMHTATERLRIARKASNATSKAKIAAQVAIQGAKKKTGGAKSAAVAASDSVKRKLGKATSLAPTSTPRPKKRPSTSMYAEGGGKARSAVRGARAAQKKINAKKREANKKPRN